MLFNYFLKPEAVAIIGASSDKSKIGRIIVDNLVAGGYKGKIYPINLKTKKIAGLPAFPALHNIPTKNFNKFLVVIAIPAQFVVAEIEKCGRLGLRNIIIISAGFKEAGKEGETREAEIVALAKKYKLNILGPNCLGLINNNGYLNASFADTKKKGGRVALISQSGAVGSAVIDFVKSKNFNLGCFVSLGNKAVLDENDFLSELSRDKNISAFVLYLENIKRGEVFMETVSKISKTKPVVILKAGITERGKEMAVSHTGAMAGSGAALSAGLKRAGALMVDGLEELFNVLALLEAADYKRISDGFKIVTNAGGVAVLSADEIVNNKLSLVESIDVLGDADNLKYEQAILKMLKDGGSSNILVLLTPQTNTKPLEIANTLMRLKLKYPHRLIAASFLGGESLAAAKSLLEKSGILVFDYPERAIKAFKVLVAWKNSSALLEAFSAPSKVLPGALASTDFLALIALLKKYKIPTVKTMRYGAENNLSFPAVIKAVGPNFIHKTDKGAVVTGLAGRAELEKAAAAIYKNHKKEMRLTDNYLVVQPQIEDSLELIIGFKRDISFGPVLLVGLGGIYAEILKEIKLSIADLNKKSALKLIKNLSFYPILNGARNGAKYDVSALVSVLVAVSKLAIEHPEIKEFDINPLFIGKKGVCAADVRVVV